MNTTLAIVPISGTQENRLLTFCYFSNKEARAIKSILSICGWGVAVKLGLGEKGAEGGGFNQIWGHTLQYVIVVTKVDIHS